MKRTAVRSVRDRHSKPLMSNVSAVLATFQPRVDEYSIENAGVCLGAKQHNQPLIGQSQKRLRQRESAPDTIEVRRRS